LTESRSPGADNGPEGKLLYKGAEADIIKGMWQGTDAVYKVRKQLLYRLPILDDAIRRSRTIREAQMIRSARSAGVRTPYLYAVDVPNFTLVMEFVGGERVSDVMQTINADEIKGLFRGIGRNIGSLHKASIMHGDLTTANIVRNGHGLVFIDFGLAVHTTRIEDFAVDLRLIKETLGGAYPKVSSVALDTLYEGYAEKVGKSKAGATLKQLRGIERRGRYARMT
jgi:Kae1-associated kinase Bud32